MLTEKRAFITFIAKVRWNTIKHQRDKQIYFVHPAEI